MKPAVAISLAGLLGGFGAFTPQRESFEFFGLPMRSPEDQARVAPFICGRLKRIELQRPRPWRTASRFDNRNLRRQRAIAAAARQRSRT